MHIPDGYLSPATCGAVGTVLVPAWVTNRAMLLAVNLIHERTHLHHSHPGRRPAKAGQGLRIPGRWWVLAKTTPHRLKQGEIRMVAAGSSGPAVTPGR